MTIFLNGILFWITITFFVSLYSVSTHGTRVEKEEAELYESLQESINNNDDNSRAVNENLPRYKRSQNEHLNKAIYESEIKVLGRTIPDDILEPRVTRSSGNHDISIAETPIDPNKRYQDLPIANDKDTMKVVSSVDKEGLSKDTPDVPSDSTVSEPNKKESDSDLGTGIEVESEEKLADDDTTESTSPLPGNQISLSSRSNIMDQVLWPSGTYGLPKPHAGCPDSSGFIWKTGTRFYDTEDDGTENHKSVTYHLAGDVTEDGITLEFCIKTKDVGVKSWPSGKYCVYKKGPMCPDGLRSGFVYWDDENRENKNFYDGTLPEGVYNDKTKIVFCCSVSGNVQKEILLPTDKPFYLFPYGSSTCQKVRKMKSTLEFVKFDEEDKGMIEKSAAGFYPYGVYPQEKDHTFFMCYYEQEDEDELSLTSGVLNSKKVAHSEKVIHEFMKAKESNEEDGIAKQEISRPRNVKNFQPMQTSTYHAIVIATGFVLTTIAILVAALLVISYFTKRWTKDLTKHTRGPPPNETRNISQPLLTNKESPSPTKQERSETDLVETDLVEETETEQEDEELVEDQFLPSDSQLKSGLEFLFLKQQKKKWLARNNRKK